MGRQDLAGRRRPGQDQRCPRAQHADGKLHAAGRTFAVDHHRLIAPAPDIVGKDLVEVADKIISSDS